MSTGAQTYGNRAGSALPLWAAVLAGLLAGAIAGLIAAIVSVPLRRLAGVSDRSVVNGISLVVAALALWTAGGFVYGLVAARLRRPVAALAAAAVVLFLLTALLIVVGAGPAAPYPPRFASCALPLAAIVIGGGALLLPALLATPIRAPLRVAAPVGLIVAAVGAVAVANGDKATAVHYTLSRPQVTAAAQLPATGTVAAAPAVAATPNSTVQATPAAPAVVHFTVSDQSEASYTIREKLARLPAPSDAVGKTNAISGDLYLLNNGLAPASPSAFTVDLRTLTSDAPQRDRFIHGNSLESDKYPNATYTINSVDGFPASYKEGDEVKLTLNGTFKVHDTERPATWTGSARYQDGQLEAVATTQFNMRDYNITPPNLAIVQAEDTVRLDLHLIARRQPS